MPRTLVIEAATAACSVALIDGRDVIARAHVVVGRGHAEQLVPMIAGLPDGGRASQILVDCGPGSFTGVRVGIAAARGLALGWSATVAGYSALPLVAATALSADPIHDIAVVMEGGHGEVFMQLFSPAMTPLSAMESLKPEAALGRAAGRRVIGNGVRFLTALDPNLATTEALPDAANVVLLDDAFVTLAPRPIYGRAPDAKPQAPR